MKKEPSSPFITSLIEMKLDNNTRFEWQKHSQASDDVPDYNDLLKFLNLRAQAAESAMSGSRRHGNNRKGQTPNLPGREFSHLTHAQDPSSSDCVECNEKHPLYPCKMFKDLSHDKMVEVARSHNLCLNCLKPGHYSKKCTSLVSVANVKGHITLCCTLNQNLRHKPCSPQQNRVNQSIHVLATMRPLGSHLTHSS